MFGRLGDEGSALLERWPIHHRLTEAGFLSKSHYHILSDNT